MPHCLHLFPLVSCHAVTADLEPRLRLVRCLGRCLPWDHPRSTEETRPRSPHLAPPSPHGRSCAEADPARRRWWRGQDIGRWLRRRRRLRSRRQGWGQEVASLGRGGCGDGAGGGSVGSQGGHLPCCQQSAGGTFTRLPITSEMPPPREREIRNTVCSGGTEP